MLEYLRKKLELIADTLLDPLIAKIVSSAWWVRLLVLLLVFLALGGVWYRHEIPRWVTTARYLYRVRGSNTVASTLRGANKKNLDNTIKDMEVLLRNKLDEKGRNELMNAWTTAQLTVALSGRSDLNAQDLAQFFNGQMHHECNCWREFAGAPNHIGATAWVLIAITRIDASENDELLTFLLANIKPSGWWPIYPAEDRPENASTYATAISLLALKEHLDRHKVKPENEGRVRSAIISGQAWLLSTQVPGKARWYEYPNVPDKKTSVGLSGFVLHVLHRLNPNLDPSLDQLWLRSLPTENPLPTVFDIAAVPVQTGPSGTVAIDHVRYYVTEWVVIGTVDAFKNGSLGEKAAALSKIERMLDNIHEHERDALQKPWVSAEFLISLRYLNGENLI